MKRLSIFFAFMAVVGTPGCTNRPSDAEIAKQIAMAEQIRSPNVVIVSHVKILDGWSDGLEAEIAYLICEDSKLSKGLCKQNTVHTSFLLDENGRWKMFHIET